MKATQHKNQNADSVKLRATATSVSVDVEGGAATRSVNALLDLISPFTNASAWLGDKFSHARSQAAIRAAAKAAKMLKDEGISAAQIPPKILLPWLEGASLETNETESLTDAWAGLFARAAKSSDAVVVSYMETLKKLGKDEAELLEFFATDTSPFYSQKFYEEGMHIFSETNPLRVRAIEQLEGILTKKDNVSALREFMNGWGIQGMCQIIFFSTKDAQMLPTPFFEEHEHAIANLEHLGLTKTQSILIDTKAGDVEVIWFQITKYAFDLIWACQGTMTGIKTSPKRAHSN